MLVSINFCSSASRGSSLPFSLAYGIVEMGPDGVDLYLFPLLPIDDFFFSMAGGRILPLDFANSLIFLSYS
jgi:hypothetical protein